MRSHLAMLLFIGIVAVNSVLFLHQNNEKMKEHILSQHSSSHQNILLRKDQLSFSEWQNLHAKKYQNNEEYEFRRRIFMRNIEKIVLHNKSYKKGLSLYYKGANKLADLTDEEFTQIYNWGQEQQRQYIGGTEACNGSVMDAPNPPLQLDWDNKVTAVLDQGTCGKDWAIVAIGAVQSLYALKVGQLPVLSVQQLLQCSGDYGNQGCHGGFMDQAFYYMIDKGIATSKTYPERSLDECKYVPNMKFTGFSRCARVPTGNHSKLVSAITQQPVSVALDFSQDMRFYAGGIFDGACSTKLTHGMLLTGYGGKEHGTHYWKLRNTLGSTWGSKGYIDMLREDVDGPGKCGIQVWPSVPQSIA